MPRYAAHPSLAALAAACLLTLPSDAAPSPELHVSGPYSHENLHVWMLEREPAAQVPTRKLTPLARALREKKVVVRETGQVNQLTVENTSDEEVFVQAGEIVKGGKQDRVLGADLLLPPKSGPLPIAAHCVESGRWRKRGDEAADRFGSAQAHASDKALKLANYKGAQGEVWENVAKVQRQLHEQVGADVRARASASSLQLTLEHESVQRSVAAYEQALAQVLERRPRAVGFVFALGGELNSAEVYASRELFAELWPKLLHASAVEAVAARRPGRPAAAPTLQAVRDFLQRAERGPAVERAAGPASTAREGDDALLVETKDARSAGYLHRSYVNKK
jgi:hypothetical protein